MNQRRAMLASVFGAVVLGLGTMFGPTTYRSFTSERPTLEQTFAQKQVKPSADADEEESETENSGPVRPVPYAVLLDFLNSWVEVSAHISPDMPLAKVESLFEAGVMEAFHTKNLLFMRAIGGKKFGLKYLGCRVDGLKLIAGFMLITPEGPVLIDPLEIPLAYQAA